MKLCSDYGWKTAVDLSNGDDKFCLQRHLAVKITTGLLSEQYTCEQEEFGCLSAWHLNGISPLLASVPYWLGNVYVNKI
jgi:hypothetical protein